MPHKILTWKNGPYHRPSRVGRGPRFELTGCVSETRPRRPKVAEIVPPLWAIRALTENTGHHTPKWKRTEYSYSGVPWSHPGSVYTGESEYDYDEAVDTAGMSRKAAKKRLREKKRAAKDSIPKGNLREEDYRFWKGFASEGDPQTVCRWCHHNAYNGPARKDHHRTNHCNAKLMIVYKLGKGLEHPKCFACGKLTRQDRWGVPLCQTPACLARWKFQPMTFCDVFSELQRHALVSGFLDNFKDELANIKKAVGQEAPKRP